MPEGVKQAIIGIWVTIGLSVVTSLINIWTGAISSAEFTGYIIFYSLMCIFPYKMAKGSNAARWIYSVLFVASVLLVLGGVASDAPKADWIVGIITLPLQIFIFFRLFQPEASEWFRDSSAYG